MVRRFFGQWLLELRVQRYENGKTLGQLEAGGPLDAPPPDLAAKWQEEMKVYVRRSGSLLVPCDVIRGTGATAAEVRVVGQAVLEWKTEALDADVGRLEGLRVAFQAKLQRGEPDRDVPPAGAARGIRYDTRVIRRFFEQWEAELRGQRDENRRTRERLTAGRTARPVRVGRGGDDGGGVGRGHRPAGRTPGPTGRGAPGGDGAVRIDG